VRERAGRAKRGQRQVLAVRKAARTVQASSLWNKPVESGRCGATSTTALRNGSVARAAHMSYCSLLPLCAPARARVTALHLSAQMNAPEQAPVGHRCQPWTGGGRFADPVSCHRCVHFCLSPLPAPGTRVRWRCFSTPARCGFRPGSAAQDQLLSAVRADCRPVSVLEAAGTCV